MLRSLENVVNNSKQVVLLYLLSYRPKPGGTRTRIRLWKGEVTRLFASTFLVPEEPSRINPYRMRGTRWWSRTTSNLCVRQVLSH